MVWALSNAAGPVPAYWRQWSSAELVKALLSLLLSSTHSLFVDVVGCNSLAGLQKRFSSSLAFCAGQQVDLLPAWWLGSQRETRVQMLSVGFPSLCAWEHSQFCWGLSAVEHPGVIPRPCRTAVSLLWTCGSSPTRLSPVMVMWTCRITPMHWHSCAWFFPTRKQGRQHPSTAHQTMKKISKTLLERKQGSSTGELRSTTTVCSLRARALLLLLICIRHCLR